MRGYLLLVAGCVYLGFAQPVPQSDCKPVTRFGVHGCDPLRNGSCPKGYDWISVCPPNPTMKAPCRLMCVPHRKQEKKEKASPKAQSFLASAMGIFRQLAQPGEILWRVGVG
jgi:hypothetical protein